MPTAEELLTEMEIKSLLTRERFYRDSCQWKKLRESYHPDDPQTYINISWFIGNASDFATRSEAMYNAGTPGKHTFAPIEISVNGSKATSISTGSVNVRMQLDGYDFDIASHVWFVSRLVKIPTEKGEEWRMLGFSAIYDRDTIVPSAPLPPGYEFKIDIPEGTRESYKYLTWVLEQRGYAIARDLPGTDDEASKQKLLDETEAWLRS